MKTIVLTGGGTAGHVMPNIALLPLLKKDFNNIHYIGSEDGIEKDIISKYPEITFHSITCAKLKRAVSLSNLTMPFKVFQGTHQAKVLLKKIKPDIIFSKGGYVAVPVVMAHGSTPVVCHESDLKIGLANKLSAGYAKTVCTTFETTAQNKKNFVHTGSPIRDELFLGIKERAISTYDIGVVKPVVLITGGSLGSKSLNKSVRDALPKLLPKFDVLHIVGKGNVDYTIKTPGYSQVAFTTEIQDAFALADIVVTRGGSNAIHELLALTKPMLIIPLPKAQSRGDQIDNAKYFEANGWARVLLQENLTTETLTEKINLLHKDKLSIIQKMSIANTVNGNQKIVDVIKTCIQKK